jgi:hypothetical protein
LAVFQVRVEEIKYAVCGLLLINRIPNALFLVRVPIFWIKLQFGAGVFVGKGVFVTVGVVVGDGVIVNVLVGGGVGVIVGVVVGVGVNVGVGGVKDTTPRDKLQAGSLNSTVKPKWS